MKEDLLIEKWKPVLEWSSKNVPLLSLEKYSQVARILEKVESKYMKDFDLSGLDSLNLLKVYNSMKYHSKNAAVNGLIPQIRKNEGELETVIINNELHYVLDHFGEKWAINPNDLSGKHSVTTTGYHPIGYVLSDDGWVKITKINK